MLGVEPYMNTCCVAVELDVRVMAKYDALDVPSGKELGLDMTRYCDELEANRTTFNPFNPEVTSVGDVPPDKLFPIEDLSFQVVTAEPLAPVNAVASYHVDNPVRNPGLNGVVVADGNL